MFAFVALAAASAAARFAPFGNLGHTAPCATPEMPEAQMIEAEAILARFERRVCGNAELREIVPMCGAAKMLSTIPTVVHVLYAEDGRGNVSDARVLEQMEILNNDFAGRPDAGNYTSTNFRFELTKINRVENTLWFSAMIAMEQFFKAELSVSPIDTLNVYFGEMNGGVAGMCYFPYMHVPTSFMHGCLVHHESVVGGSQAPYNEGQTLVHEVGHGLGLQHVWQGGCLSRADGDHVDDTPPQETNSRGCPDPVPESCAAGLYDSIHSHMDYSDDACRLFFTPGQSDRIDRVISLYHPGYLHPEIRGAIEKVMPDAWNEAQSFMAQL